MPSNMWNGLHGVEGRAFFSTSNSIHSKYITDAENSTQSLFSDIYPTYIKILDLVNIGPGQFCEARRDS